MADTSFYSMMHERSAPSHQAGMIGAVDPVRIQSLLAQAMDLAASNFSGSFFDKPLATSSVIPLSPTDSAVSSISTGLYDALVDYVHSGNALPSFHSPSSASVMLYVAGGSDFGYQFDEEDISKFMSDKFGPISSITLSDDHTNAIVTFLSGVQADNAIARLNGRRVREGCVLRAIEYQWGSPTQHVIAIIRKYTCRFDIQIDNDKEFHVARRIIGQKGANMKRIVKQSGYDAKLRLRGKGSGFLEGALKQESQEPLHLCVSCKDYNGYKAAVDQINELLTEVYAEYKQYCRIRNQQYPSGLRIVMHEHPLMFHQPLTCNGLSTSPVGVLSPPVTPDAAPVEPYDDVESLVEQRNEARRVCNFAEADRIRDLLRSRGIGLMDEPGGRGRGTEVTTWRFWNA
jgi:hypothetical protein